MRRLESPRRLFVVWLALTALTGCSAHARDSLLLGLSPLA
jgi:hypothetical protein